MIKIYSPLSLDYIEEIFLSINKNLLLANEKDNPEAFNELLDFIFTTFISKSFDTSLPAYSRAVNSLITIYSHLQPKYKEIFINRISLSLAPKIYLANEFQIDKQYLYLSFQSIINILKKILEEDNFKLFNEFLKSSQGSIFRFDARKNKFDYLFKFSTTLLCWLFYLKFNNKISYNKYQISIIEKMFSQLVRHNDENFINRFYQLYNSIEEGLWHIDDWYISEPPLNVVRASLMPRHWLPFGLILILLKYNHLVQINNIEQIYLDQKFKFQLEDISKILGEINSDNEIYLDFIFPNRIISDNLAEQLKYRKEKIIELFTILKRKVEIDYFTKIKSISLSENKIDKFRKEVGKKWENNTSIINLLKLFNKINYKDNVENEDGFGFFQTVQKGKFAFIDGENYQYIYGLSDFGDELARSLDNQFFKTIMDKTQVLEIENLNEYLEEFVLSEKNNDTTVIFADWTIYEKVKNIKHEPNKISFSHGSFYQIPIVNSYNDYEEYIFIVDFDDVEINIYRSDSEKWYNSELLVDVTEYQKSEITDDKIKEWKEKDSQDYSMTDVDVLESNNINIKVIFKGDYLIKSFKNIKIIGPLN